MLGLRQLVTVTAVGLAFVVSASSTALAAETTSRYGDAMRQARRIRVAKMASEWKGKRVTLETRDGRRSSGRLVTVHESHFVLEREHSADADVRVEVPVDQVVEVTLHAGLADILLGGLLGVASGVVVTGVLSLGSDAGGSVSAIGGIGGFVLGSLLGIRLLHRDTVVSLDPSSGTRPAFSP